MDWKVSVLARVWLDEETFELTCTRPQGFFFLPGQYVALELQGEVRDYTILSPPDAEDLRFLIKQIVDGKLSRALGTIILGTDLGMGRAKGYLTYRPTERPVYFVATGVGIAPFVAMAASGIRGFTLIHGARSESGFFYRQELATLCQHYIPCLSRTHESRAEQSPLYRGYVTEYIRTHLQPGLYDFYLCGSRAMVHDMTHLLDQYHTGTRIFSEAFS